MSDELNAGIVSEYDIDPYVYRDDWEAPMTEELMISALRTAGYIVIDPGNARAAKYVFCACPLCGRPEANP